MFQGCRKQVKLYSKQDFQGKKDKENLSHFATDVQASKYFVKRIWECGSSQRTAIVTQVLSSGCCLYINFPKIPLHQAYKMGSYDNNH